MAHALSAAIAMTTMCTTSEKKEAHEIFLVAAPSQNYNAYFHWNMTKTHTSK